LPIFCKDCDERWPIVCDFCWFYVFNGEWINGRIVYTENGFCSLTKLPTDPYDGCEQFHCFQATREDAKGKTEGGVI
jgi:hypothetical protein